MATEAEKPAVKILYWIIGNDPEAILGMGHRTPSDKWVACVPIGTYASEAEATQAVIDYHKEKV